MEKKIAKVGVPKKKKVSQILGKAYVSESNVKPVKFQFDRPIQKNIDPKLLFDKIDPYKSQDKAIMAEEEIEIEK